MIFSRSKKEIKQNLQKLGISEIESNHYANKTFSLIEYLATNTYLNLSDILNNKKEIPESKIDKIRSLFPESKIIKRMIEIKIPEQKIKEYLNTYYSNQLTFLNFFNLNPYRKVFEKCLNETQYQSKEAVEEINRRIFDFKSKKEAQRNNLMQKQTISFFEHL